MCDQDNRYNRTRTRSSSCGMRLVFEEEKNHNQKTINELRQCKN